MKTVPIVIIITFLLGGILSDNFGYAQEPDRVEIVTIKIEGIIQAGTAQYVKRAIREAERRGAVLMIDLNTPGGLLKPTEDIVGAILEDKVTTVAYVSRPGSFAFSAGTFILLSAQTAAVHPNASIGAAQPRLLGMETAETDDKTVNAVSAWIRSVASQRNRPADVAEEFVTRNLTLTGFEALEHDIIDAAPFSADELFSFMEIEQYAVMELLPSFMERLLSFLALPQLVSLFLAVGTLGLIMAFRSGEFEILAPLAVIALLLGLWGIGSITVNSLGAILVLIGIALVAWELISPGFEAPGIIGMASLILGSFIFGNEPLRGGGIMLLSPGEYAAIGAGLAVLALFILISRLSLKVVNLLPQTGSERLRGKTGIATENIVPYGRISIEGESWRAESFNGQLIPINTKVEVLRIEGNTAVVRPKDQAGG